MRGMLLHVCTQNTAGRFPAGGGLVNESCRAHHNFMLSRLECLVVQLCPFLAVQTGFLSSPWVQPVGSPAAVLSAMEAVAVCRLSYGSTCCCLWG